MIDSGSLVCSAASIFAWSCSWKWRWLPSPVSGSVWASRIIRSASCVERWCSATATSGPASATASSGDCVHSATSARLTDAMIANDTAVPSSEVERTSRNRSRAQRATIAAISGMLTR